MTTFIGRYLAILIAFVTLTPRVQGSSVTLGTAAGTPGSPISIPIAFAAEGAQVAGLSWTMTFSSADFIGAQITVAPAATQAGKQLSCIEIQTGSFNCVL